MALSSDDFRKIEKLIKASVEAALGELKIQISYLPTKDEFYASQDTLITELKDIREELTMLSYRVSQHSDEIAALQKHHS